MNPFETGDKVKVKNELLCKITKFKMNIIYTISDIYKECILIGDSDKLYHNSWFKKIIKIMTEEQLTIQSKYWWNNLLSQTQKERVVKDHYMNIVNNYEKEIGYNLPLDNAKVSEISEEGIKRIFMEVHNLPITKPELEKVIKIKP